APHNLIEHDRGPCLVFDHIPGEQPLDRWLATPEVRDRIGMDDRLAVVRAVAEAVAHAHTRGVFHRALCPSAVWVADHDGRRTVRVANWHAGARVGTGDVSASMTGTTHVEALSGGDADLYRAPEHAQPLADPAALDVFSLGCLTAFVFTGTPPAPTPAKLRELLAGQGHVPVEASGDAIDEMVATFVAELTDVDPSRRPGNADDVLAALDDLEEELTRPDPVDEPHVTAARRGSTLGEARFGVLGRVGLGSTAFALLVRDAAKDDRVAVLKVARAPQLNDRVLAEGAALRGLRHPAIVELLDDPLDLDGHAALLLSFAGDRSDTERGVDGEARAPRTLAARIGEPIGAELLQRWGEDLLDAVRYLEQEGVSHRDIKPENLGIVPRGRGDQLRLVLFDFSLAGTPLDRIEAGTQGYLDPFLRRRGRWDPAAERYSAAVVLYEMATGTKPVYGDGRADPALVDAPLQLDRALFEPSVADGLADFFDRALAPDVADRFGTADDMLWAWRQAFREAARPATHHPAAEPTETAGPAAFAVPPGTAGATPLAGLPLSNRALNALEREDILTVADLLSAPVNRLFQLRGVGNLTRNELRAAVAALRAAVPEGGGAPGELSLGAAADLLVPRVSGSEANRAAVLRAYLGLSGGDGGWPTQAELARSAGVSRQRVAQVLASARQRWSKQPTVTAVRDWLAAELTAMGGLASLDQLAARLAGSHPLPEDAEADATGDGDADRDGDHAASGDTDRAAREAAHRRAAVAMARASLVVEAERAAPRFAHRVLDPAAVVVALDDEEAGPGAQALADYASTLAARTAELLADRTVVPRGELVAALRDLAVPEGAAPLGDAHLAEMAASLTPDAAVNSRLELYRRGLGPGEALAAARRA
ncbi:MAG TPA: DNA-directed RNA polymerase subunit alpha C-terminal domain-containing protein, partial [Acidimicrobiales bacterium]